MTVDARDAAPATIRRIPVPAAAGPGQAEGKKARPIALLLKNGTEVEDPRDLIPAVGPESKVPAFANEWAAGRARWTAPGAIASAFAIAGFGGTVASLLTINQAKSAIPTVASLVLLIVGPIVSLAIGKANAVDVDDLLEQSFQAYLKEVEAVQAQ